MTYTAVDTSVQDGKPVELYKFTMGATSWLGCTGMATRIYLTDEYEPMVVSRSQVQASQEFGRSDLSVDIPHDHPMALLFTTGYPTQRVNLTIFRNHVGDAEFITYWRGRVVSATIRNERCTLKCEPIFSTLRRIGLRAVYQIQCRHALYERGCELDRTNFDVVTTVQAVAANVLTVTAAGAQADNYFTMGYVQTALGARMIVAHSGTSLTLNAPIPGLVATDSITLYPGCDLTLETCTAKFSNDLNYGGFRWIPTKNPFQGDALV